MSEFKEIVNDYVRFGDAGDMVRLAAVLGCLMDEIRTKYPEVYKKYIIKAKLANRHIEWDREQAEYAVSQMRNKDGSVGEHWGYTKTTEELNKKDFDFNPAEWYYVLNMVYSDHYSPNFQAEIYVDLAKDILSDADAPKGATKLSYVAKHF